MDHHAREPGHHVSSPRNRARVVAVFYAARARTWATILALLVPLATAAGPKTDVVVLVNGDHVTGEIKGVSRGKLDYATDDAGRLSIEWIKVVSMTSIHSFEIETSAGERHYGSLLPSDSGPGFVRLIDGTQLPIPDIVSIVPLDAGFVSRVQAYLDLGFTFAKAHSATTLTSDGSFKYRGERLGASTWYDLYLQDDEKNTTVNRTSVQLMGELYSGRWTAQLIGQAERNDELDLQLRLTAGGGASYKVIQNNSMDLSTQYGLAGLSENYVSGGSALYLTGYVAGIWDVFRYDSPKLDTGVSVTVYPYLTDPGRVRIQASLRVQYEVFSDFNTGLMFNDTFDSRPPDPAASRNDFTATVTIGWSYRR